jgi:putative Ca2+/H+ antiporter (TMEM165/GDT1 family)
MGDKTQIATAALAARFGVMLPVIGGSAIGMMAVDIPTVLFGHLAGDRLNPRWVRYVAAALFALYGILAFFGADFALW